MKIKFLQSQDEINHFITNSWRPAFWDKAGKAYDENKRLLVNTVLSRRQWERLDEIIISRVRQSLNVWGDIQTAGLTAQSSLATWLSSWNVASERIEADVTMDFRSQVNADRTDRKTYSVPIPLISTAFSFGRRELITAQTTGQDLETFEAEEAGAAVAETAEKILIDGETGVVVQGSSIPGLRTLTARYTGSAVGDFGTLSNIYPTFTATLQAMAALRYRGPFNFYMASAQYHEMLEVYSDGTGQTALQRCLNLPKVSSISENDLMTAGQFVGLQMSRNVVDLAEALAVQVRRWNAPDESEVFFVVVMSAAPRLKTDYAGNAGIAHISSA